MCKNYFSLLEEEVRANDNIREWDDSIETWLRFKRHIVHMVEPLKLDMPYKQPPLFTEFYVEHICRVIKKNSSVIEVLPYIMASYYWNFQKHHNAETKDITECIDKESKKTPVDKNGNIKLDNTVDTAAGFIKDLFFGLERRSTLERFADLFMVENFVPDFTKWDRCRYIKEIGDLTPDVYEKYLQELYTVKLTEEVEILVHEQQFYRKHLYLVAVYSICELACCNIKGLKGSIDFEKSYNLF